MNNQKKAKYLTLLVAIFAFVSFGTIVFAGYTQQLDIQGKATVKKASWSIKFENLQDAILAGTAEEVQKPTINTSDTKISEYNVSLTTPGDSVTYKFEVVNDGTFDAKISSVTIPTPVCTGSGESKVTDETNICSNLSYTLTYDDENNTPVLLNDTLNAGETKNMKLTLTYSADLASELLPKNDVDISNLSIAIIYSQSNNSTSTSVGENQ